MQNFSCLWIICYKRKSLDFYEAEIYVNDTRLVGRRFLMIRIHHIEADPREHPQYPY